MQAVWVQAVGKVEKRMLARVAALALLLWACDAIAAPAPREAPPASDATVVAGDFPHPELSVTTTTLPGFDIEGGTHSSRVDVTVMPNTGSAVGLSLGIRTPAAPTAGFAPPAPATQSLDLGLRWRYTMDSGRRFDVTAYRRMPERDALSMVQSRDPSYGARFEMALGSRQLPKKGFVAQHGFVGLQLESGARLTIKRSGGVPMLYYRNTF
jgi:hypothetical protein